MTNTNKETTTHKIKGKGRGRFTGSYGLQGVMLSELIEKLDPSSIIPVNIRYCRIKQLSGNLLQASTENIKALANNNIKSQENNSENSENNSENNQSENNLGVEVTNFNSPEEKPIAA